MKLDLNNKSILITGGTGSFGKKFIEIVLKKYPNIRRVVVYSRDELKQFEMAQVFSPEKYKAMRYFIGDIRDKARMKRACEDVDYIIHLLNSSSTKHEFDLVISSTAQPKINKDNLKGLIIPIPPKKEQEQISKYIEYKSEKLEFVLLKGEEKIVLLKEYRQSLISSAVTGKVRITEAMI